MATIVELKPKHFKPAIDRTEFLDMIINPKKREALYNRFEKKKDDDDMFFIDAMRNNQNIDLD
ncbi:hypothetical protein P9302_00425 [Brevibacillus agri]|uniref:hypothetical protein n=1 Tax=Brevibacillus agri TaxID=51101 RepID=UPI002E1E21EC|nr:hypothetical protein [Brevibacillus agri]